MVWDGQENARISRDGKGWTGIVKVGQGWSGIVKDGQYEDEFYIGITL